MFAITYTRRRWRFVPFIYVYMVIEDIETWAKADELRNRLRDAGVSTLEVHSDQPYIGFEYNYPKGELLVEPKTELELRLDRHEKAISILAAWVLKAESGIGLEEVREIEDILANDVAEETKPKTES